MSIIFYFYEGFTCQLSVRFSTYASLLFPFWIKNFVDFSSKIMNIILQKNILFKFRPKVFQIYWFGKLFHKSAPMVWNIKVMYFTIFPVFHQLLTISFSNHSNRFSKLFAIEAKILQFLPYSIPYTKLSFFLSSYCNRTDCAQKHQFNSWL